MQMEISYHVSWRRNSQSVACDATTVASGNLLSGEGALNCQNGCSGTITSMSYICTAFSIPENWLFGERRLTYNFASVGAGNSIRIGFSSCCWISPFSSSWNLATTFSLTRRSDNNEINSTPRATTAPVIRLQAGCSHTISIAVTDPDGDIVRCRWAVGTECSGICNQFPGAVLNSSSCTITYQANMGVRFWAAAIMIEDFTPGSSQPLSSVALQFLVQVVASTASTGSCSPPIFVPPTPTQGMCVQVPPNSTFTTQLTASSGGLPITEIQTIGPTGTIRGPLQQTVGNSTYYINITWTPASNQQNQIHLFCYTAVNSNRIASTQTCIQLFAGRSSPLLVLAVPNQQLVDPSNTTWNLTFDKDIERPSVAAFISFHDFNTEEEVYRIDSSSSSEVSFEQSNGIAIKPNYTFAANTRFYITLERGIVLGHVGCGATDNEPVEDKNFWTFRTMDSPLQCFERGTTGCCNVLVMVACRSLRMTLPPSSIPPSCTLLSPSV